MVLDLAKRDEKHLPLCMQVRLAATKWEALELLNAVSTLGSDEALDKHCARFRQAFTTSGPSGPATEDTVCAAPANCAHERESMSSGKVTEMSNLMNASPACLPRRFLGRLLRLSQCWKMRGS